MTSSITMTGEANQGPEANTQEKHIDASSPSSPSSGSTRIGEKENKEEDKKSTSSLEQGDDEDETEYPKGVTLVLLVMGLCFAVFLVALDQTIIATAIPKITDEFKALKDVGWYGSSYMLTMCSFQLIFGKIYTFFSLKWCYLFTIFLFEVGSLICGIAPNSTSLIIGRAVAGIGSSGIFSGAIIILAHSVPLRQRPLYSGLIGAMFGIASVAGPLMGGAFTDHLTWRWCFYINLPIGAVTMVCIVIFFKPPHRKQVDSISTKDKLKEFDFLGTLFFIPAIVSLLLALQWGGTKYAWGSGRIIGLLCSFSVLTIAFIIVQLRVGDSATLPPRLISQRSVAFGALTILACGASFMVLVFYVPIWFQAIKGATAMKSGIMIIPLILGVVVFSILSGGGVTWLGHYVPFMIGGSAMFAVGVGLITTFRVDTPSPKWIGYQFLAGAGIGSVMQQPLIAAQTVLNIKDIPVGSAAIVFAQTLGGALFISVAQNVFGTDFVKGMSAIRPGLTPSQLLEIGATSLGTIFTREEMPRVLVAYNHALVKTSQVALVMACLTFVFSLGMEWASVKGKKIQSVSAA